MDGCYSPGSVGSDQRDGSESSSDPSERGQHKCTGSADTLAVSQHICTSSTDAVDDVHERAGSTDAVVVTTARRG